MHYSNEDFENFYVRHKAEGLPWNICLKEFCVRNKVPWNLFDNPPHPHLNLSSIEDVCAAILWQIVCKTDPGIQGYGELVAHKHMVKC